MEAAAIISLARAREGRDPEVAQAAERLLELLTAIPEEKRVAAAECLLEMLTPPKAPKRGGEVLNNVIQLFREQTEWKTAEIVRALHDRGYSYERKAVFNALTYLSKGADPSHRILRKFGYGKYQLENGSVIDGPP